MDLHLMLWSVNIENFDFLALIVKQIGHTPLKQPSEEQYLCQEKMQKIKW